MAKKTSLSTLRHQRKNVDISKFEQKLDALITGDDSPPAASVLSDLDAPREEHLRSRWTEMSPDRRDDVVRSMVRTAEEDITKHFDRALQVALDDPQDSVRLQVVDGLAESEDPVVMDAVLQRVESDPSRDVRAAMVELLSRFTLLAEYGELESEQRQQLREALLRMSGNDPDLKVRFAVLEALAYLSDAEQVPDLIQRAYDSGNHEAQVSAIRSMGRQADPRWTEQITQSMDSDESELRYEAARAAGFTGTHRVVPKLIDLTDDEDAEVQLMAITSLGEIGGDTAVRVLENLTQSDSPAVAEAAESALDTAVLLDHPVGPPRIL